MTQDFSYNHVQYSDSCRSRFDARRLGPLAIAVALVSGCASNGGMDTAGSDTSTGQTVASAASMPQQAQTATRGGVPASEQREMADASPGTKPDNVPVTKIADTRKQPGKEAGKTIDQSPIAVSPANPDIATSSETPTADADKESDMTVLVLDNPELMAKAAQINAINSQVDAMDESPRKPHRMKFHYGFNKHRLSDEERDLLLKHAAYLKAHPDVTVRINGHTDNYGADEYNDFLSRLRAKTAARILEEAGVDEKQITVRGWGSKKPLTNPQDRAANRRIDLEYQSEQMAKAQ